MLQTLEAAYQMESESDSGFAGTSEVAARAKALLLAHELVAAKFANEALSQRGRELVSDTSARPDGTELMPMGRALELAVLA